MPSDDSAPHPLGYYRGVLRTPREPLGCRVRSLSTEILRYQGKASRIYLRAAAEAERIKYAIRLPANQILQHRIGDLLKRPVGRPSNEVRRFDANFTYQGGSWTKPRRVIAKVEWHPGELYPRVGFIVTNLSRPAERVVVFYNKRGTCEQWIKEGKGAIKPQNLLERLAVMHAHACVKQLLRFAPAQQQANGKDGEPWGARILQEGCKSANIDADRCRRNRKR